MSIPSFLVLNAIISLGAWQRWLMYQKLMLYKSGLAGIKCYELTFTAPSCFGCLFLCMSVFEVGILAWVRRTNEIIADLESNWVLYLKLVISERIKSNWQIVALLAYLTLGWLCWTLSCLGFFWVIGDWLKSNTVCLASCLRPSKSNWRILA